MKQRLVLLDIDGTILHGGKLWRECFEGSVREHCVGLGQLPRIGFSGKTDRQICRELMQAAGFWADGAQPGAHPQNEARIDAIIRGYLDRAKAALPTRSGEVKVLPGARELIAALAAHSDVTLGLLTGNVREGAEIKLGSVGLYGVFKMGAFGDDHWDRYELPAIAAARAAAELGLRVKGKQIVIVGDTIHDIGCGQKIGARAIGVGTGHGEARARVHGAWQGTGVSGDPRPDHYFEDLSNLEAVLRAILSDHGR